MSDLSEEVFETIRKIQAGGFNPADIARFDAPVGGRGVSIYKLSEHLSERFGADVANALKQLVFEERVKVVYEDELPTFYIP